MSGAQKLSKSGKTSAARLLDTLGVAYEVLTYEVDLDDLTAPTVARKIGMPAEQVFKTLLTQANTGEHLFAVVPGNAELDPKKLAAAAGVRKVELAPLKEVEPLTGYVRGAVTVLAARKPFRAFADEVLELFDTISISAGQRGMQLVLSPVEYLRATGAELADLTRSAPPGATQ